MKIRPLIALPLLMLAAPPAGAGSAEAVAFAVGRCASIPDNMMRLACYDQFAAQVRAGFATPAVPRSPVPPPAVFPAPVVAVAPPPPDDEPGPVKAGVAKFKLDGGGMFTVTLDNGQVWRQNRSDGVARLSKGVTHHVTIERGMFGSYNLTFDHLHHLYKVTRIR